MKIYKTGLCDIYFDNLAKLKSLQSDLKECIYKPSFAPIKQETFTQYWIHVDPPSSTVAQHEFNIG